MASKFYSQIEKHTGLDFAIEKLSKVPKHNSIQEASQGMVVK